MTKRKQLGKTARFEIFKRDGFACQYCGSQPPAVILVLDHIVPVKKGGATDADNLVTACEACNQGKAARSLTQVPATFSDKAAAVAEREAQLQGFHDVMEKRRLRIDADAWTIANLYIGRFPQDGIRTDYFRSIKLFNEKLGIHAVREAMERAIDQVNSERGCFMYFCKFCWRLIKEPQT